MMKYRKYVLSAIVALATLAGPQLWAQNGRLSTVAITSGVVAVTERTAANTNPPVTTTNQPVYVGDNLAGLTFFNGNPGIDGLPASPTSAVLFTLTGSLIPGGAGTDLHAFMGYGTLIGPPTLAATYNDVAPLLVANTTYEGLAFVEPNLFPGGPAPLTANVLYTIHHAVNGTDYLAAIVPATGGGSAVLDIKPMSWAGGTAGGPASLGNPGYFALTFAEPTPTGPYFANLFYYLRTDSLAQTQFGYVIPALVSGSLDTLNLSTASGSFGVGGYTTLAYAPVSFGGYAASQFYYLRQDTGVGGTGNTILGRLDTTPGNRTISDIANLGGVYETLSFVANATGTAPAWGSNQLFVAGAPRAAGAQSISFPAIADQIVGAQFAVTPTASSGLDLVVTVVSGPATIATTGPIGQFPSERIFTVTTTGPGVVKLQATQAGSAAPLVVANMMQQSFNVLGLPSVTSADTAAATVGAAFSYAITATGDPIVSYAATGLPASLVLNTTSGMITGVPLVTGVINATIKATNATGTSVDAPLTITVAPAGVAPIITSATTAPGTVGTPFVAYLITATGSPTSFGAAGLPAGLVVNTGTGAITGTPTAVGTSVVTLSATNSSGADTSTLTITVAAATVPPVITSPTTAPATVGVPFIAYRIEATGLPTSYGAIGLPLGLAVNTSTGRISGTPTTAGTYNVTLVAANSAGVSNSTLIIVVAPPAVAPIITGAFNALGSVGVPFVTYRITATGLPTSFTASGLPNGLTVNALTGAINGTPTKAGTFPVTIQAINATGTSTGTLTIVVTPVPSSRIVNFSARALSGPAHDTLIMGFVVQGNGKNLLVRGIGPGLTTYGVSNPLADPRLTLYGPAGVLATNDDWQVATSGLADGPILAAAAQKFGAFALASGSKDSALIATFNNGAHTTSMVRPNSTTGVALTEIYDIDSGRGARLINVSARMNVTAGEGTLIAGMVLTGNAPRTVLIRGIGPTLTTFGVPGVLADPSITVFRGNTQIATNDNWEAGPSSVALLNETFAETGAFSLAGGSKDAALVLTLQPGNYTVHVTGVGAATGVALVEVYDVR